jgi:hypothetical protein
MKVFSLKHQFGFIDRLSPFCSSAGICSLMDNAANLYVYDGDGHFTRVGAQFLGQRLLKSNYFN